MTIVANQNSPLAIILIDPATGLPYSAAGGSGSASTKVYQAGTFGSPNFTTLNNPFNLGQNVTGSVILISFNGQIQPLTIASWTPGSPLLTINQMVFDYTNFNTIFVQFT